MARRRKAAPKKRRKYARRRRRNPGVAAYLLNPRRRTRRRRRNPLAAANKARRYYRKTSRRRPVRRRRNPAAPQAFMKDPMGFVQDAAVAAGALYGSITVGNFVLSMMAPDMQTGFDVTAKMMRAVTRAGAAWAGDIALTQFAKVSPGTLRAYRTGAAVGIIGSFIFDLVDYGFTVGSGDYTQMPLELLTVASRNIGLAGTGAYTRRPMAGQGAYVRRPMAGQGAYTRQGLGGNGGLGQSSLAKQSSWAQ